MSEDQDIKKMIQQGFDTVAQGYDHPSLSFFPETAKRMMHHLDLNSDQLLLDVCTGTGVVALAAAELLTEGKVTGIDLSRGMLEQAKSKASVQNLSNAEFLQMDLDHLDFADGSFDIASSSFGLFFLEDMTHALNNISRVVKSGGKITISTFTGEAFSPMSDMFLQCYESFGMQVPSLSWKRLSTKELIQAQFEEVGITKVNVHHEPLGYQMTDAQMWWDVVWNAGYRSLLNQLTEQQQIEFKEKHIAEINQLLGEEGVWFNTEVLIAVAEKK
ncbi:MAG: class I SAM-dependent methyltransferase [Gammaproteobacteria bacterium]|nr:class I SAM-dependent methyltransferase [Gammaproteobacteria bacterium]